jgi:hypothetical protein
MIIIRIKDESPITFLVREYVIPRYPQFHGRLAFVTNQTQLVLMFKEL